MGMSHIKYIVVGSNLWRRVVHSHKRYPSDPHIRASKHEGFIQRQGSSSDYRYCTSYYDQLKESDECEVWRSCSGSRNVRTPPVGSHLRIHTPPQRRANVRFTVSPCQIQQSLPDRSVEGYCCCDTTTRKSLLLGFLVQAIVLNSFSIYRIATSHFKDCFTTSINGNGERICFGALK